MADNQHRPNTELPKRGNDADNLDRERIPSTDSDEKSEQVRSSNTRNQQLEREGVESQHNSGHDSAARGKGGQRGPTDPDSAESDVDRDDTITD